MHLDLPNRLWVNGLLVSVQNTILLIATGNGIQNLKVVRCFYKGFGIVAIVQDVFNVHFFELQQFGQCLPIKFGGQKVPDVVIFLDLTQFAHLTGLFAEKVPQ